MGNGKERLNYEGTVPKYLRLPKIKEAQSMLTSVIKDDQHE